MSLSYSKDKHPYGFYPLILDLWPGWRESGYKGKRKARQALSFTLKKNKYTICKKSVGGINCKFLPLEFIGEYPINSLLVISSPWDLAKVRWLLLKVSGIKLPRLTRQCAWGQIVPAAPYFEAFIILSELNYINSNHLHLASKHSNPEAYFKSWCSLITG